MSTRLRTSRARSRAEPRTGAVTRRARRRAMRPASRSRVLEPLALLPTTPSRCDQVSTSSLPVSSRERSSRSATIRDRRSASRSSWVANRGTAPGSSLGRSRRVSAAARIVAAGVFSSCDAFATKSRRTASSRRASVTSRTIASTEPSSPAGTAWTRSHRSGEPTSTSRRSGRPRAARIAASRSRTGNRSAADPGRPARWRSSASFANAVVPSGSSRSTPSCIDESTRPWTSRSSRRVRLPRFEVGGRRSTPPTERSSAAAADGATRGASATRAAPATSAIVSPPRTSRVAV